MVVECRGANHRGIPESTDPARARRKASRPSLLRATAARHPRGTPTGHGRGSRPVPDAGSACSQTTGHHRRRGPRVASPRAAAPTSSPTGYAPLVKRKRPGGQLWWSPRRRASTSRSLRIGFVLVGLAAASRYSSTRWRGSSSPWRARRPTFSPERSTTGGGIRLVIAVIPIVIVTQVVISALHIGFVGIISWPVFLAVGLTILIWRNASARAGLDEQRPRPDAQPRERGWAALEAGPPRRRRRPPGDGRHRGPDPGPPEHGRAAAAGRGATGHRRHRAALRPLVAAPRPRPGVGAAGAGAGRGAGRDGGAHPRLGAADAGPDPAVAQTTPRTWSGWPGRRNASCGPGCSRAGRPGRSARTCHGAVRRGRAAPARRGGRPRDPVQVGDGRGLRAEREPGALLAAAREATVNAAKWSGAAVVSLFAEVEPDSGDRVRARPGPGLRSRGRPGRPPGHRRVHPGPDGPATAGRRSIGQHRARAPR